MKILFLGYAVHPDVNQKLTGKSEAGNKMELGILHEMKYFVEQLDIITVYPVAPFPHDRALWITGKKIKLGERLYSKRVGFCNLPIIKQIMQIWGVYCNAKSIVKRNKDTVVVSFNMYPQVGIPASLLRRRLKCKLVPILADLPIDDNYRRKGISKAVHNVFNEVTKHCIKRADKVIVLNKYAREVFAPNKKYLVVDGGINISIDREQGIKDFFHDNKKHIVYTGSLAEYSGITEMIRAMRLVENRNIVLDIFGSGTLKNWISELSEENIVFHGVIDNKTAVMVQKQAWLLVNPRPVEDEIAKVTFPSKIFEYMYSGTPVLTTKLNGFTPEYYDKLFLAEDNSAETLAKWIQQIDELSGQELLDMGERAKKFVETKKTWKIQVERIMSFLGE